MLDRGMSTFTGITKSRWMQKSSVKGETKAPRQSSGSFPSTIDTGLIFQKRLNDLVTGWQGSSAVIF